MGSLRPGFELKSSMLTSYLGLRDKQLSPPGGGGSWEETKEEEKGWALFGEISLKRVARINSKIK